MGRPIEIIFALASDVFGISALKNKYTTGRPGIRDTGFYGPLPQSLSDDFHRHGLRRQFTSRHFHSVHIFDYSMIIDDEQ